LIDVLVLVGFVSGVATGLSPCVLPVLPVILATGAAATRPRPGVPVVAGEGPGAGVPAAPLPADRLTADPLPADRHLPSRHALTVVGGLVLSFSLATLLGSWLLGLLGLPQDLLRDLGLAVLAVVGLGLVVPALGEVLSRPFARAGGRGPRRGRGAFLLGVTSGLVFVPCAGPVLAAITAVGASHRIGASSLVLTCSFALGVAVPLVVVSTCWQRWVIQSAAGRRRASVIRRAAGVLLVLSALAIASGWTDGLQRLVPGYTDAVQSSVEANASARSALAGIGDTAGVPKALRDCTPDTPVLLTCGPAPALTGITRWFNTPGNAPLTLAGLKGKVVLVDFWTYSCINCQRALPHVEAWAARYRRSGLVVVGVHTPEFAFEHVASNVAAAVHRLGVTYPVALDNNYATWDAYGNAYWPADYLIDRTGHVRFVHFGEGAYGATERTIRRLLVLGHRGLALPAPTDVPTVGPTADETPESYLGYARLSNLLPPHVTPNRFAPYRFPTSLPLDEIGLAGNWDVRSQRMVAGDGARLELAFRAKDVYLVAGGSGTVTVQLDGKAVRTVRVSPVPRLYRLIALGSEATGRMVIGVSPGVSAYDLTFG